MRKLSITCNNGSTRYGYKFVEYKEILLNIDNRIVSIRKYPKNTVILYKSEFNERKNKIQSKIPNNKFNTYDIQRVLTALHIIVDMSILEKIEELLKSDTKSTLYF